MICRYTVLSAVAVSVAGCGPATEEKVQDTPPAATSGNQTAEEQPAAVPADPVPSKPVKQVTFGKSKARLVDYAEARKNPKIVKVENRIDASDPLTASYQSYFSIGSRATLLGFRRNLDLQKELNGGNWPSFEEFSKSVQQMRIEFVPILPWQMLAYHQADGSLVLLEDKGEKIQRYKAKGIPLDEDDKPFDTE